MGQGVFKSSKVPGPAADHEPSRSNVRLQEEKPGPSPQRACFFRALVPRVALRKSAPRGSACILRRHRKSAKNGSARGVSPNRVFPQLPRNKSQWGRQGPALTRDDRCRIRKSTRLRRRHRSVVRRGDGWGVTGAKKTYLRGLRTPPYCGRPGTPREGGKKPVSGAA